MDRSDWKIILFGSLSHSYNEDVSPQRGRPQDGGDSRPSVWGVKQDGGGGILVPRTVSPPKTSSSSKEIVKTFHDTLC